VTATTVLSLLGFTITGCTAQRVMPDGTAVRVESSDEVYDRSLVVTFTRGSRGTVVFTRGLAHCLDVLIREVL
jgi:hypothetical protein